MKTIAILLTTLLWLAQSAVAAGRPPAKPEEVGLSAERLARIAQVLRADVEAGRIAGGVILVARPLMRSLVYQAVLP